MHIIARSYKPQKIAKNENANVQLYFKNFKNVTNGRFILLICWETTGLIHTERRDSIISWEPLQFPLLTLKQYNVKAIDWKEFVETWIVT